MNKEEYFLTEKKPEVYLLNITGLENALISMYMSKGTINKQLMTDILYETHPMNVYVGGDGQLCSENKEEALDEKERSLHERIEKLVKWGKIHPTMLKFITVTFVVMGMHRGGQDDWDSHAQRFNNRIIRYSTRLADIDKNEMSGFYEKKILGFDDLEKTDIELPEEFEFEGNTYLKTAGGYVMEEYRNSRDVLRGLNSLSLSSNFIFSIDIPNWGHVYSERNEDGTANPEVKYVAEKCQELLEEAFPYFTKEYILEIKQ